MTRLRQVARDCAFGADDKSDQRYVRRKLLEEPGLSLQRSLEVAAQCERVEEQLAVMKGSERRNCICMKEGEPTEEGIKKKKRKETREENVSGVEMAVTLENILHAQQEDSNAENVMEGTSP